MERKYYKAINFDLDTRELAAFYTPYNRAYIYFWIVGNKMAGDDSAIFNLVNSVMSHGDRFLDSFLS